MNTSECAPPTRWVRQSVELPGMAWGWVPNPVQSHVTMLYSMTQVQTAGSDRAPTEGCL